MYTPEENYVGTDSFTYSVSDSVDSSLAPVTVTIDVASVNDLPSAKSDGYAVTSSQLVVNAGSGILANDSDIDGPNALTAELVVGPQNGELTLEPDGALTYIPADGFTGRDSFTYRAGDGEAVTDATEVVLFVQPSSTGIATPTGDSVRDLQ